MYIPKKYEAAEWELSKYLITDFPLGTIITTDGGIIANHIPFFYHEDEETGERYLQAHMQKKNHQVAALRTGVPCMVIFQSQNSYVQPDYYPSKQETHKFVPTWDFAAVHCTGTPEIIDDPKWVRLQLENITRYQEKHKEKPWQVSDAPESYLSILQKTITGLQVRITDTQCKYKFEQGMKKADVEGVIEGLAKDGKPEVSELVKEANKRFGTIAG